MVRHGKREGPDGDTVPALKILIVDDKQENRYLLEAMLGSQGFATESASNGIEALEHLKKQHFDAIISDLLMPKMDGFQLLRTCKNDPGLRNIPFIIYTATYTDKKDVDFGLSLGAARYLIKPAEPDVLLRELEETLGQVTEGALEEAGPAVDNNGMVDQEYGRRLVAKLDKKILDLEKSEEKYRAIVENSGTGIVIIDRDGTYLLVNKRAADLMGARPDEIVGSTMSDFLPADTAGLYLARNRETMDSGTGREYEDSFELKTGRRTFWIIDRCLKDPSGRVYALQSSSVEITGRKRAETALKESEDKFRQLFENSPLGIVFATPDFRFFSVNPAWVSMTGYPENELLKMSFIDITHPDNLTGDLEHVRELAAGTIPVYTTEKRYIRKDKSILWGQIRVTVIRDHEGALRYFAAQIEDITERKRAENALFESEEKYRTVFENTGTAMVVLEENNLISLANAEFAQLSGFSKNDIEKKKRWTEFVVKEDMDRMLTQHRLRRQNHERALAHYEFRFVTKSGDIRDIFLTIDVIPGTKKSVASLLDITERKRAEEELRKSEDKFRNLFDLTNDAVMLHTLTTQESPGRFIDVNHVACHMLGYTRDELLGMGPPDIVPPEHHPRLGEIIRQAATQDTVLFETKFLRKDGTTVPVESSGHVIIYEGKKTWLSHIRDITERKQAEDALRESEEKYRTLVSSVDAGIILQSASGKILTWNPAAERIFGISADEVLGHVATDRKWESVREDGSPYPAAEHPSMVTLSTGKPVRNAVMGVISSTGTFSWISINTTPLVRNGESTPYAVVITFQDITDRKRAEEVLKEQEHSYRTLAENLPGIVYRVHIREDGRMQFFNLMVTSMTGYTPEELSRGKICSIDPLILPEDRDRVIAEVDAAIKENRPFRTEYRLAHKDGSIRSFLERGQPVFDNAGLLCIDGIIQDITESKKAEEQRETLIRELAQKNAELDRFTYTVSHDLKSPLITIRSFLFLLENDLMSGDTARVKTDITRISESAEKLEHLITTLLALSRSGRTVDAPVKIPFSDLAREAARQLDATIRNRGVALVIPDNLPAVSGDRHRMLQVMTNLLDNAVKFMGDQKDPCVEVSVRTDAGVTVFCMRDNGMGFKGEDLPKVFGLYERFNPDIPGTGIGLATVKRIIEAHGGEVWIESEGRGKGTTVCFTLPAGDGNCIKRD